MKYFKKLIVVITAALMLSQTVCAADFDPDVDYMNKIIEVLKKGGDSTLLEGREYELKRNAKISWMGNSDIVETNFFDGSKSISEIKEIFGIKAFDYTDYDLLLLSRIIDLEMGAYWAPDWVKKAVGSVVLNRVKDKRFPNTIEEVIFQPGQYYSRGSYIFNTRVPSKHSTDIARELLENGPTLPEGVIGQGPLQGPVYISYYDRYMGTTTYFCY